MMRAYDPNLINKTQTSMGWMLDYAVNNLGIELETFYMLFLNSRICKGLQTGESRIAAGMSGVEMAREVLYEHHEFVAKVIGIADIEKEPSYRVNRSPEYWLGWALCYYSWYQNLTFKQINDKIKIDDIRSMYKKYHEMDITQFVDSMNQICEVTFDGSALRRLRLYAQLSQRMLAEKSGVPVRTIQQYEQRQKDISRAGFDTVLKLSQALCCRPEELVG